MWKSVVLNATYVLEDKTFQLDDKYIEGRREVIKLDPGWTVYLDLPLLFVMKNPHGQLFAYIHQDLVEKKPR